MYPKRRVAVPIRENRNFQRYADLINTGWACKTYGLTSDGQIVAFLSKEQVAAGRRNVLGVDVNSKCFAVSVLAPGGKVLKQLYYGKDIWVRRKRIMSRRDRLQGLADRGSHRAKRSFERLKAREGNFVRNRIGEVVRDITDLPPNSTLTLRLKASSGSAREGEGSTRKFFGCPSLWSEGTLRIGLSTRISSSGL